MSMDILEGFAVWAICTLMLFSITTSLWQAYRSLELGRRKWLRPSLLTLLLLETVMIFSCWEYPGNLMLLPLDEVTNLLFILFPLILLAFAWYFKDCILNAERKDWYILLLTFLQTVLLLVNMLTQGSYILQSVDIGVIMLIAFWQGGSALLQLQKRGNFTQWAVSILSVILALWFFVGTLSYLNPFDRQVEFTLVAQVELPYMLSVPRHWEGVYSEFGLYSGPLEYSPDGPATDVPWPEEMDLKKYSYIVCYGAEMESLIINIWETDNIPIRRCVYKGRVSFGDENFPTSLFIYQIKKLRIEN